MLYRTERRHQQSMDVSVRHSRSEADSDDDTSIFSCFDLRIRTNSFDLPSASPPVPATRVNRVAVLSRMFRSWSDTSVKSAVDLTAASATMSSSSSSTSSSSAAMVASSAAAATAAAATGITLPPAKAATPTEVKRSTARVRSSPASTSPRQRHFRVASPSTGSDGLVACLKAGRTSADSPSSTARPLRPGHRATPMPLADGVVRDGSSAGDGVADNLNAIYEHRQQHQQRLYGCSSGDESDSCQLYDVDWIAVGARRRLLPAAPPPSPASSASSSSHVQRHKHASFLNEVQVIEFDRRDKVRQVRSAGATSGRSPVSVSLSTSSSSSSSSSRRRRHVRTEPLRTAESPR